MRIVPVFALLAALLAAPAPGWSQSAPAAPQTLDELQAQVDAGDPVATEMLADAYAYGKGAPRDPAKAIAYYELALARGREWVPYKFATALLDRGLPEDSERAYGLLRRYEPAYASRYGAQSEPFASYLMLQGYVAGHVERYEDALEIQGRTLAIVTAIAGDSHHWTAQIRLNLSATLAALGRHGDEARLLEGAIAAYARAREAPDPGIAAGLHNNLGNAYEELSRFPEAVAQHEAALKIAVRAHGRNSIQAATTLANLASATERAGNPEKSVTLYKEALATIAAIEGSSSARYASNLADLGTVYLSLGRLDEALAVEREALPLLVQFHGQTGTPVAIAQVTFGHILNRLGRPVEAIAAYETAYAAFAATYGDGHEKVLMLRAELAAAKSAAGRNAEAVADFKAVLPELTKTLGQRSARVAIAYNNLGIASANLGAFADAIAAYGTAAAIWRDVLGPLNAESAASDSNAASALERLGRDDAAIALLLPALAVLTASGEAGTDVLRRSYFVLARTLRNDGLPRAAALFSKLAINSHESLRAANSGLDQPYRASFTGRMAEAYDMLVEQMIADGAFSQAQFVGTLTKSEELSRYTADHLPAGEVQLTLAEKKAAAAFRDLLRPLAATGGGTSAVTVTDRAMDLFRSLERQRRDIQQEEMAANAAYAAALQKELGRLGKDVALYQAIATDDTLHLFVSLGGRETLHREVPIARPELARMVFDAAASIEGLSPDADARLHDLYRLLFAPVAADIAASGSKVVMLDLSGFLRYVPYAALYSGSRYLVEDYALALYGAAARTTYAPLRADDVKGVGFGVTRELPGFAALPGVAQELEAVFRGADGIGEIAGPLVVDGDFDAASLKRALRRRPAFVHIASHFRFEPGREDNSYLLLGTGEKLPLSKFRDDAALRFAKVELLTLSACETARGGGSEGDEIESFGALSQRSGAAAVLATLWPIADRSTAQLMADFYRGMIVDRLDKASALQRAQIALLRGLPLQRVAVRGSRGVTPAATGEAETAGAAATHPYYWAAFILMGNWL